MKKALVRFFLGDPAGQPADGRMIGIGLATAISKQHSAERAEHYMTQWVAEHDVQTSARS
ncbi:hypothetical protein [Nonomuraea sp. LPB2021202275-12-8]|uniref:hypothetical protein n=1 Tax=Nonomuraea sp. LPB2021202275-12-8 TaxID=3120159 RepID=UPI00300C5523